MNIENIYAWNVGIFKADVEEKEEDIDTIINYSDHGDSFICVRTKSGKNYEYGYYLNRPGWSYIPKQELERFFLRPPVAYKADDDRSALSNELYSGIKKCLMEDYYSYGWRQERPRICKNQHLALLYLDIIFKLMDNAQNSGVRFNKNDKRGDILEFLKNNGIDTEENVQKVKSLKMDSRIDGVDGICGKIESDGELCGDTINYIIVMGEKIDPEDAIIEWGDDDEWGVPSFLIDIAQFDQKRIEL